MIRSHLLVHGHVQGVGFRYFTLQQAQSLEITGWVKNNVDGTVEIEAQGESEQLKRFIERVKKGSPFSKVQHVQVRTTDQLKNYRSFRLKY
ncbi:acylphosphatase [Numidum massiliense]|uniref:acylphosphatase n=1 Tax=Numidum massiliense TaxID=1522315 RepID=UPI0006D5635B|nr:acylphosphatase [Numidum massiliense]